MDFTTCKLLMLLLMEVSISSYHYHPRSWKNMWDVKEKKKKKSKRKKYCKMETISKN